jgi:NADH:ubiquinone oxidoreductase subunit 6 (subunit J)
MLLVLLLLLFVAGFCSSLKSYDVVIQRAQILHYMGAVLILVLVFMFTCDYLGTVLKLILRFVAKKDVMIITLTLSRERFGVGEATATMLEAEAEELGGKELPW